MLPEIRITNGCSGFFILRDTRKARISRLRQHLLSGGASEKMKKLLPKILRFCFREYRGFTYGNNTVTGEHQYHENQLWPLLLKHLKSVTIFSDELVFIHAEIIKSDEALYGVRKCR